MRGEAAVKGAGFVFRQVDQVQAVAHRVCAGGVGAQAGHAVAAVEGRLHQSQALEFFDPGEGHPPVEPAATPDQKIPFHRITCRTGLTPRQPDPERDQRQQQQRHQTNQIQQHRAGEQRQYARHQTQPAPRARMQRAEFEAPRPVRQPVTQQCFKRVRGRDRHQFRHGLLLVSDAQRGGFHTQRAAPEQPQHHALAQSPVLDATQRRAGTNAGQQAAFDRYARAGLFQRETEVGQQRHHQPQHAPSNDRQQQQDQHQRGPDRHRHAERKQPLHAMARPFAEFFPQRIPTELHQRAGTGSQQHGAAIGRQTELEQFDQRQPQQHPGRRCG